MAFKDWVNNLRDYFVEEDETFDETPRPVQKPKPVVVPTPSNSAVEEKVRPAVTTQTRDPQRQTSRPQVQQRVQTSNRPFVAPKEKTLEKNSMNQTTTVQQQASAAISTIAIKEPRAYADIMEAARIIKNGESVLVNFKYMGDNQARRSIDFMTGVAFTIDGDIQNVGGQIFLMTPAHITVDAAKEMSVLAGKNFESYDLY